MHAGGEFAERFIAEESDDIHESAIPAVEVLSACCKVSHASLTAVTNARLQTWPTESRRKRHWLLCIAKNKIKLAHITLLLPTAFSCIPSLVISN